MNNAKLLPFGLYDTWVPAFAELFHREHGDWPAFYRAVKTLSGQSAAVRQARLEALLSTAHAQRQDTTRQ